MESSVIRTILGLYFVTE